MLPEKSGTLPPSGRTRLRPGLGAGLTPGLSRVYFARLRLSGGRNWAVPQTLFPRGWSCQTSITLACPCPGTC